MKPDEWMTSSDYKKLFEDNGELPKELRNALKKYSDRLQGEMAERSKKVSNLAEFLFALKTQK